MIGRGPRSCQDERPSRLDSSAGRPYDSRVPPARLPRPLILASASPRRAGLLERLGLSFTIVPSEVEEVRRPGEPPEEFARRIAREKALSVASRVGSGLVIGCDTIVVVDGDALGKPSDPAEARRMLGRLSGRAHQVISGLAVAEQPGGRMEDAVVSTKVWFKTLTAGEIEEYAATGEPMDKAGAYGIQELGMLFVSRIEGDHNNVVGLPVFMLARILEKFGVKWL